LTHGHTFVCTLYTRHVVVELTLRCSVASAWRSWEALLGWHFIHSWPTIITNLGSDLFCQ